jgi:hypothetical protein
MFYVAYAFLYALALLQAGFYYGGLPPEVATHFAPGGKPDTFTAKDGFILFYLAFTFFIPALLFAVGSLLARLPARFLNLPNKDYWLAPARRAETIRRLSAGFRTLGLMSGLFLVAVGQLVIRANMQSPPRLDEDGVWVFLGFFTFCVISFLLWMALTFGHPARKGKG